MLTYFYINASIAVLATILTVFAKNAVHALLYFIVSLLSLALIMYALGAPFAAALEVIVYAGAIMVLFIFVVMLLNVKPGSLQRHFSLSHWKAYLGPIIMTLCLVVESFFVLQSTQFEAENPVVISVQEVAKPLFTTYTLVIELASFLLLAGLIGAYHVGRKRD